MALGRTRIVAPLGATDIERKLANRTNIALRALDRRKPIATPSVFRDDASRPAAEQNSGRIIFVQQADGTVRGQYSDGQSWQTFLATAVSFATPTITYATTAASGSLTTTIRSDATLKFPTAIMSSANASTLTLTDDATDQTLTGSLGSLNLRPTAETLSLPSWTGGGANPASVGVILGFLANSNVVGTSLRTGVDSVISYGDSSTYSSATFRAIKSEIRTSGTNSPTYTNVTCINYDQSTSNITLSANTHVFTKRTGILVHPSFVLQSGSGAVTVTDYFGIEMATWPVIGTPGTVTNARAAHLTMPTLGATIRRGVHLVTSTSNVGTEAANVEGFYCEDITRGTARRANFYAEGATTGTPTDVYAFYQGTAHVVGTNRYGFRATGATTGTPTLCVGFYADGHSVGTTQWAFYAAADESYFSGTQMDDNIKHVLGTGRDSTVYYDGTNMIIDPDEVGTGVVNIGATGDDDMHLTNIEIDGALNHDGTTVGFYAVAPTTRSAAYTPTNVTADRAYDANATTVDELADVLGTLIADLQLTGIIG